MGLQPNQTGPLNIAGGLQGEGNDLGSHHTSLETEIHHRQTDRRTDKSRGGEPTSFLVLSPLHPLKKKVKHWLCRPQPTHPPIAACVGLLPATGSPKTTSYGSSLTLVCSWQLRALFFPQPPAHSQHLLPPTRTFPLSCSLLSGLPGPGLLGETAGTFLLARAPLGPVCPACGTHTAAPLSLRSGAERCRRIRGGVVYGG